MQICKMAASGLTFLFCLFCFSLCEAEQKEISLNGDNWMLSDAAGKVKYIHATVPGIVHLDLLAQKIIDDPYFGYNDDNLHWVAYSDWIYNTTFDLSDLDMENSQVFLKCDGLDTIATLSVNGQQVGTADNYFRRWLFNITDVIKGNSNTLDVCIEAAANYSTKMKDAYPYEVYVGGNYIPDAFRNFIRKTQSDFGWDWGPAFVPAGIWQNISIIVTKSVYISDIVPKPYYNATISSYLVEVLVCFIPLDEAEYKISVDISLPTTPFDTENIGSVEFSGPMTKQCERFYSKPVRASDMDDHLWRPRTSRIKDIKLHSATVTVTVFNNNQQLAVITRTRKVGFRNIELVQEPPPNKEKGLLFYFQQSDSKGSYPIYIKGSNFIPMDAFVSRGTPEVARRLLTSAVEGNQNMIRVWGGGLYQPDWFYDLCDELGIMVWQEFMFAVSLYPRDEDFLNNIREEVTDVVRRLDYHPSIVLWSGNNENQDYAIKNASLLIDYSVLYDQAVRATLWNEDLTRPYWPSSPSNGVLVDDPTRGLYIQRWGESQDTTYGDIHRYDYFDLCNNVSTFPRPRFASEFGFQSYPSFYSLSKIASPSDLYIDSPFLKEHRNHHPDGDKQMEDMMAKFFHLPNNTDKTERFKDFIYLTQIVQTICIGSEAEHYRRILSEPGAYTRGTLYWQLNDIWQAQTWSSIEYNGRWKLLHYTMKRIYSEVVVSAYELNEMLYIYVAVDQPDLTIKYSLHIEVYTWDNRQVNQVEVNSLTSEGFTGTLIANYKISDLLKGTAVEMCFLYIWIMEDMSDSILSSTYFFPANFTNVNLLPAKITASNVTSTSSSSVVFYITTSAIAPYVALDSGAIEGYFSDNGFLMFPNVKYNMTFTSWSDFSVQEFSQNFNVKSLADTYMN